MYVHKSVECFVFSNDYKTNLHAIYVHVNLCHGISLAVSARDYPSPAKKAHRMRVHMHQSIVYVLLFGHEYKIQIQTLFVSMDSASRCVTASSCV